MKINPDYVLNTVNEEYVVVAVGESAERFCGMIRLNETRAFLWGKMQDECTEASLIQELVQEYHITESTAKEAVRSFLEQIVETGAILR